MTEKKLFGKRLEQLKTDLCGECDTILLNLRRCDMPKSASIHARIEPELKEEAEAILKELGLNSSQAITLFYQQIKLNRGLPFMVRVPNETTRQTLDDTDAGKDVVYCRDAEDLFERLNL